uniref:Uncharacterized protein n=1 Tax=Strigamia maritima TaxID=126957 RepID=T1J8P9_STRMM
MAVLEHKLPQFFSGMTHMLYNELVVPKMNKNLERPRDVSEDLQNELRANLTMEYELYDYAKQRLLNQFAQIQSSIKSIENRN